jgi:hypothetical protein
MQIISNFVIDRERATKVSLSVTIIRGIQVPSLKIPDRHRLGMKVFLSLSDPAFSEILGVLKRAPSLSSSKELAAWVVPEVKMTPPDDVKNLVNMLTSLYRVKVRANVSAEQLAEDAYIGLGADREYTLPADQGVQFKARLATIIKIESLSVVATKAQELRAEFERTFCEARIFTDLRPVFGGNVEDTPTAMIIVHTLKLGYHDTDSAEHKEMFIAVDSDDIAKLTEQLVRAAKKEKTLKARLEAAGIKFVDLH